ncbi:hypothetical protein [Streptomyces sp. GESEQ-13]|uniref:hypothetical protein n=1 Tax=Streptomyces sp. GESEQ-13 TaxID=2812654 RepID=UPI001B32710C
MTDLLEVSHQYDREAGRTVSMRKADRLRRMRDSLRYMVGNRDGADPMTLRLHLGLRLDVTTQWCRRHGYHASIGANGLTFQRDGEPPQVASLGDILRWDGRRIVVERGA